MPYPRRRSSSSISLASMASNGTQNGTHVEFNVKEEGQLRYWTSDMCNRSPELFDFVVTVCMFFVTFFFRVHLLTFNCSSVATALSCSLHGFSNESSHLSSPSR